MPKVSVIIPTHNRVQYVGSAIQSVLAQTFRDCELIVIDDASADGTSELLKRFDDPRIKLLRLNKQSGGSVARNQGISVAKGMYIAFLDDDDEWAPTKLEKQVRIFEQTSVQTGGVYTGYVMVNSSNAGELTVRIPTERGHLYELLLKENYVGTTSTVIVRRECFDKVGLFDERLPSFQDHDMWLRIAQHFEFECIPEALVRYRVHEEKIWTNLSAIEEGIRRMLDKYGGSALLRKGVSYSYLRLGVEYITAGEARRGRAALFRAIRLYPFEPRHYFNLTLSFFGPERFRRVKGLRENLIAAVKDRDVRKVEGRPS